ncbi:MAG: hydroxymethylglutaryl-CoA lyase, partial [Actinobacteria bacterium]|nr:hydroxymethylglutaryl-CoA lyase [Actinomycetota bacterium]
MSPAAGGRRLPDIVTIREVGARDGLQSEEPLSVDDRVRFLDALSACGFPKIEAVSFVSPEAVPAMADGAEVWRRAHKAAVVHYSALVPNRRGAEAAVAAGGFSALQGFIAAADGYNTRNLGKTVEESMLDVADVARVAGRAGLPVEVSVSCAFGDPYEGDVSPERVAAVVARLIDMGISGVSLGDTTGMATPGRVWALVEHLWDRFPDLGLNLHFHDTRGLAMANVLAALEAGVTELDASVGGIGGSPFAGEAGGNVATED